MLWIETKKLVIVIVGALLGAIAMNFFLIPAKGSLTNENKEVMMVVITRYELFDLERIIKEVDPNAFTNIMQTVGVFGLFRKD